MLGAWDVFDLQDGDGNDLTFGTPEWDDYVAGQVRSGIAALVAAGVSQVGLLEVACMRPVPAEGVPAYPERADDARVAHLNALWHEIADADPGTVTFVDGPTEWCQRSGGGHRPRLPLGRRARVEAGLQPHLRDDRTRAAGARGSLSGRAALSGRSTPAGASR